MNKQEIQEKVVTIITEQKGSLGNLTITPNSHLKDDLGLDSLDSVELIMAFEEKFNIEISDNEAEKITTVEKAVIYLEQAINKKNENNIKK